MSDTVKPKMPRFLKAELAVLFCIFCIWVIMSVTDDLDSTKAEDLKHSATIRPYSAEVSEKARENT